MLKKELEVNFTKTFESAKNLLFSWILLHSRALLHPSTDILFHSKKLRSMELHILLGFFLHVILMTFFNSDKLRYKSHKVSSLIQLHYFFPAAMAVEKQPKCICLRRIACKYWVFFWFFCLFVLFCFCVFFKPG